MAKYRIQRAKGVEGSTVYAYSAAGHYECVPTRLHDIDGAGANDIEGGKIIMGITYFVPGGSTEFTSNPMESIYYILTARCWWSSSLPSSKQPPAVPTSSIDY